MKSFFRIVLLALVLLVVALVSALTAMRFAIHGREVSVPNLVGRTPAEARRITEEAGFELTVEREYYSATVAEGRVLSQLPAFGTLVRRGWEIRVAESLGPQRVQIPNLYGESRRVAEMNVRRRGLEVSSVAVTAWPGSVSDQVLSQSPPADASGVAAPKISLLVAAQSPLRAFIMPNFVGQTLASAKLIVQSAGLRIGEVTQAAANQAAPATGKPSGASAAPQPQAEMVQPAASTPVVVAATGSVVASQTPAAGEKVLTGAAVNFQVR